VAALEKRRWSRAGPLSAHVGELEEGKICNGPWQKNWASRPVELLASSVPRRWIQLGGPLSFPACVAHAEATGGREGRQRSQRTCAWRPRLFSWLLLARFKRGRRAGERGEGGGGRKAKKTPPPPCAGLLGASDKMPAPDVCRLVSLSVLVSSQSPDLSKRAPPIRPTRSRQDGSLGPVQPWSSQAFARNPAVLRSQR
jgi:hypothetical protein